MHLPDALRAELPQECIDCGFPQCGDGLCDISEVDWCSIDCGYVPPPCGDGYCSDSETCSSCEQDCGTCDTSGVINVPGIPEVAPVSEMYARAEALGIPPSVGGVPNIEEFLQSGYPGGSVSQLGYPTGATSLQDFTNRLFQGGLWRNDPPFQTPGAWAPDAFGCQVRQVNERYNVKELMSFNRAADLLFPSALNQGIYINTGFGGLTPLHVPSVQRKPVKLVGTFSEMATAPASVSDVYASIGQMIQTANANGKILRGKVYPEVRSAASLEEVAAKFKVDSGILGVSVTPANNSGLNTVFVLARQPLFAVFQDLNGFTPTLAQFDPARFTVTDFNRLGDMNELGYDNLPTYVRYVTYGRLMLFSVSANSPLADLEAAANAFYTNNATAQQQAVIQNSVIQIVARAGAGPLQEAELRSYGHWQDSFHLMNVPVASIQPIAYEVRRLDDQLATMSRTTQYMERNCPKIYNMRLDIVDAYKEARVYHRPGNSNTWTQILGVRGDYSLNLNPHLVGADDRIQIGFIVGKPDFWTKWNGRITFSAFADDVRKIGPLSDSCKGCNSRDFKAYKVNKYTGEFTEVPLEYW